jgi:hypothetical protein
LAYQRNNKKQKKTEVKINEDTVKECQEEQKLRKTKETAAQK